MHNIIHIYIYIYYICGDQLSLEYYLGWMDWAYGLMTQSEDADISEDGQLR